MNQGAEMTVDKSVLSLSLRAVGIVLALLWVVPRDGAARVVFQSAPLIPVPNLVGYWCADGATADTATTAMDNSGNGNNGTYSGGITTVAAAPAVPTGNLRSYALTQASSQYLRVPDSPSLSLTGSFTLAAWIRPTLNSSVQEGIIEKYDDTPAIANGYSFRLDASENLSFSVFPAAGGPFGISTAPRTIALNTWTHVAGVYSTTGGTLTNYVNAAADPTTLSGVAAPTNGGNPLYIGKDYGANAFNGNIDEVRIYNRALTTTEIGILKDGQPAPTALVATGGLGQIQLTWTAAANGPTYSVLRGPSSGIYDTVFNGITGTTFTDTTVAGGAPYYYEVVAVSVMASAPSNEQSATSTGGAPPPVAGWTRTDSEKHGSCGGATAEIGALPLGVLTALLAASLLLVRPRRGGGA